MADQEKEMTFWDHLEDLRKSIIRVVLALVGATVFLFLFKNFLFDGIVLAPAAIGLITIITKGDI